MDLGTLEPVGNSPKRKTSNRSVGRSRVKKQARAMTTRAQVSSPRTRQDASPSQARLNSESERHARKLERANQALEIANEALKVANEDLLAQVERRQQAEELAGAQRRLLESVVENLPAGVGVYRGPDHIVEFVNAAYRAIAPGKAIEGRPYRQVWPEVYPYLGPLLTRVLETGEPHRAVDEEFSFRRSPDGPLETGYFSWSLVRIRLPGNDDYGILNTVLETTDRREAEVRIHRLNQELEQRALELQTSAEELHVTNEELNLANEELRAANDELSQSLAVEQATRAALESTNKELEDFTYAVSHDMRAPLSQIDQLIEVVTEELGDKIDERGQHLLSLIRGHTVAVDSLAEGLLTLARMTQKTLLRENISMNDLVRTVLDDLTFASKGRRVDIRVSDLPSADGDPMLIKQVWFNLISNAFKYTRHRPRARIVVGSKCTDSSPAAGAAGPGAATAAGGERARSTSETVYYVRDNGVGFDQNQTGRLFRAFQRLHHPEDFEGHGLGLAVVDRIVRRHGGQVWAEGAIDRGATFYFTLG